MSMRRLCWHIQEIISHGLALLLKNPKRDYKRLNILSRNIGILKGKPVVLRLMSNTLLTNSMRSNRVTKDDAHCLAAMSLYSYCNDPLSLKLQ